MFVKAKKQMGWHMGKGLLLCLAHRVGGAFLVSVSGVWAQLTEPHAYVMFPPFSPSYRQPWSVLLRPFIPHGQEVLVAAGPGFSGPG